MCNVSTLTVSKLRHSRDAFAVFCAGTQTSAAADSRRVRFEAETLAVKLRLLKGGPDYYDVSLDGGEPRVVRLDRRQKRLQLFEDLPPGPHEVRRSISV